MPGMSLKLFAYSLIPEAVSTFKVGVCFYPCTVGVVLRPWVNLRPETQMGPGES